MADIYRADFTTISFHTHYLRFITPALQHLSVSKVDIPAEAILAGLQSCPLLRHLWFVRCNISSNKHDFRVKLFSVLHQLQLIEVLGIDFDIDNVNMFASAARKIKTKGPGFLPRLRIFHFEIISLSMPLAESDLGRPFLSIAGRDAEVLKPRAQMAALFWGFSNFDAFEEFHSTLEMADDVIPRHIAWIETAGRAELRELSEMISQRGNEIANTEVRTSDLAQRHTLIFPRLEVSAAGLDILQAGGESE